MIAQCKAYLTAKLKIAGMNKIHTSMKELKAYQDSHVGAVLPEADTFTRSYAKKIYRNEESTKLKRLKLFDRETRFIVVIGEYDQAKCDVIFSAFMVALDAGIVIEGNYTALEVEEADWVDKEDSILQAKVAVQVKIKFVGGIYKDTGFAPVYEFDADVERVEEDSHGIEEN